MNTKSRILTLCLCAALALPTVGMTGCSKTKGPVKTKPTNVYRYKTLYESTYNYNRETSGGRTSINSLIGVGNRVILIGYQYDENWNSTNLYWDLNPETGEMTDLTMPPMEENSYMNSISFAEDNTVYYTLSHDSYDEKTGNYTNSITLYHADANGQILASNDIYSLFNIQSEDRGNIYLYIDRLLTMDDKLIMTVSSNEDISGIYTVSDDLSAVKRIEIPNMENASQILPKNDDLLVCYYSQNDYKQTVVSYDFDTGTVSEPYAISSGAASNFYNAIPSDNYDFVYYTNIGVYGYDIASGTETELLNWINSDINATQMNSCYIAPDGTVFTLSYEYQNDSETTTVNRLTRIPDEEVKEKYILTYGTLYTDSDIINAIVKFNRASEEYRITIRDYADYNNEENNWTGALTQFNNDITTNNIPDIIALSTEMPYQNYANKGLFADLYPLIDADTEIKREDMYQNLLAALSIGGQLYQFAPDFRITTLVGKSSIVGENDGWTMDEMMTAVSSMEDGKDPFWGEMTRENFLRNVCTMARNQFIDKESGTCSFNSEEFIKILKFAATLPEKSIWETINWDEVDNSWYTDRDYRFRADNAILMEYNFGSYTDFWRMQAGTFGADISLVGYPNENRIGSAIIPSQAFAISAQSQCKEGAWAFISEYTRSQLDAEPDNRYGFSIFRPVNKKMAEFALSYYDDYWYDKQFGEDETNDEIDVPADDVVVMPRAVPAAEENIGIAVEEDAADIAAEEPIVDDDMVDLDGDGIVDSVATPITVPDKSEKEKTWTTWIGDERIDMGMMTKEAVDHVDRVIESLSQVYENDEAVLNIILEEASAFFSGQKSAEEVAGLIQNRVFIVVNESK